jgi:hypothetical protein
MSLTDPLGNCTIIVGGVGDDQNNAALNAAANSIGAIYVAPYDGEATIGAILNVAAQALLGPNASSQEVADTVNKFENDPKGIQIVAFSGGAQAFSTAAQDGLVGQSGLDNITQITYLSPGLGPFGSLYRGPDTTIFHGHGLKDFGATFFARLSGHAGSALPCSHDFLCEFKHLSKDITLRLTSCKGTGGGSNGSNSFDGGGGWAFWSWSVLDGSEYVGESDGVWIYFSPHEGPAKK